MQAFKSVEKENKIIFTIVSFLNLTCAVACLFKIVMYYFVEL